MGMWSDPATKQTSKSLQKGKRDISTTVQLITLVDLPEKYVKPPTDSSFLNSKIPDSVWPSYGEHPLYKGSWEEQMLALKSLKNKNKSAGKSFLNS